MKFQYTNLETCHEATGVVMVIDVLRAFSNAAYAFSRGAKAIYPGGNHSGAMQIQIFFAFPIRRLGATRL